MELRIDLQTTNNVRVINAVLGQMSDGMWENSRLERYWSNAHTEGTELVISQSYDSGFSSMAEDEIKKYFAKKIKAVVQNEVGNNKRGWKRENTEISRYMHDLPVSVCYQCYDFLMDRHGHVYGHE